MSEQQLAHYSIIEKIGEGGMGEVWRAHDTRLGRDVALKFLPESLAADTERLQRFEREARVVAALNHPHIGAIYGFEHVDDKRFLVLELIDGEDLAQRLVRGPLSWQEALPLAQQIAEGLETAHEEGIVHRDLKPANVLITPTGNAKILDFGLAKAWDAEPSAESNLQHSPTIMASSPTMAGVILGTAAYMSPEQARGQAVDKRADVYAFGAVLYEMLTAKQCFSGPTVSDTLAAVLRAEADWDALPKDTPKAIIKLLRRCLDKEAKTRLRDIGEARIVLDGVLRGDIVDEVPAAVAAEAAKPKRSMTAMWIAAVIVALAAGAFAGRMLSGPSAPRMVTRTAVLPGEGMRFNLRGVHPGPAAISPNGEYIVYSGRSTGRNATLYIRELASMDTRELRGTDGAGYPFWSPDSRNIAFFADGKLKRMDLTGSPPITLCEAPVGKGGTWNKKGQIVFAPTFTGALYVVSENGGASTPVTTVDAAGGENSHRFPRFLPDGEHFLYLARLGGESNMVRVASLAGDVNKEVLHSASHAEYAAGHLLFLRGTTLMANPFDVGKLETFGDPVPVADPVRFIPAAMRGVFDVSDNGMLIYHAGAIVPGSRLVWRDLEGNEIGRTGDTMMQDRPVISPDGKFIANDAFIGSSGTGDVWIHDVERDVRTRFTFDPAADEDAVWSPDGKRLAFSSARGGSFGIYMKDFGGTASAELFLATGNLHFLTDWTDDYLVCFATDSLNSGNILAIPLAGDPTPIAIAASRAGEYNGVISADGKWMTYVSDESGVFECYVTPFPDAGRKWQISTGGGLEPNWDPKGQGIYYIGADGMFKFVEAKAQDDNFAIGGTRTLFESLNEIWYQVHPDGDRFLVLEDADEGSIAPLTLVTGWDEELKR